MNIKLVDAILEGVMPPDEEGPAGQSDPRHPRFQWTPSTTNPATKPAAKRKLSASGQPIESPEAVSQEPEIDDTTGNVSINQLLGGSRFATKDDLWAASDRMRGKLGGAGAAKWAADYGQAEFEAMAQRVVNAMLEGRAEDELKRFEKSSKKTANKANQSISRWFNELGTKKSARKKPGQT